jgi:1-deoxy-D-xylulose-5-phosphate synthase
MDRAGYVGADGATHAGSFDLAYLGCLPNMVVIAPSDEAELVHAVATAVEIGDRPSAFRYPRGEGTGIPLPKAGRPWALGKGRVLREGSNIAIVSLGTRLADALKAADELAARGFPATVADARFAKPIDTALIEQLARHHEVLITIEEASIGGFSAQVMHHLAWKGLLDAGLKVRPMVMPDRYIDHDSQVKQIAEAGLSARDIVATALAAVGAALPATGTPKLITSR